MVRGVSNACEGSKNLSLLFRPPTGVQSQLLHVRTLGKVDSANLVCKASQRFANCISDSTPCNVPSSIQAYDVPVYETKHERRLSSVPLSLEEKVRLLSMVDVFEALSEEELERLARLARDASYEQGEVLPEPQEGGEKL
jgi:hypothetical protein